MKYYLALLCIYNHWSRKLLYLLVFTLCFPRNWVWDWFRYLACIMARAKYPMTNHRCFWWQSWLLRLTVLVWWAAQDFVRYIAAESLHTVRYSRCFWLEIKSLCREIQFLTCMSEIVLIGCCTSWFINLPIIELHWHPTSIDWVSML